uniref:Glucagon / GIP / secretin / VIP family domain-containing protein n=1 Tax=Eptatretus burgeri TaxID=7764 RepID=A0A8C4N490_EPTBU
MRPIPRVLFLTLSLVLRPCSSTPPPTWTEWNADSSSSPKDKQAMDLMSENRDENLGWITGSSNSLTPADRSFVQRSSVGTNTKHNVDMKHQVNLKRQVDALFTNTYSRFRKQKAAQRFFERLLHDFPMSAPRSEFEPGQVDKQSVQVFQQKGRRAIHLGPLPRSSWKQIRWTSGSNPHHAREEVLRRILSFSLQVS